MDHLYASTLNSALRSSLSLSPSLFLEATEIYIGPKTALAPFARGREIARQFVVRLANSPNLSALDGQW